MKELDEHSRSLEQAFGLISGFHIWNIHRMSVEAGSEWELGKDSTIDIIVTKENADEMYAFCRAIRSGYSVGLSKFAQNKVKEARARAHEFLYQEANDPKTSIERKIALVRLTSKNNQNE